MSRSRRRHPFCGQTTARSEKTDKQLAHRRHRAAVRQWQTGADPDAIPPPDERESGNPWVFAKDGKQNFDPQRHPKLMRK